MAEQSSSSVTIQPANDLPRQISQHLSDKMKSRAVTRVTETLSPMLLVSVSMAEHSSSSVTIQPANDLPRQISQHRRTGESLDAFP